MSKARDTLERGEIRVGPVSACGHPSYELVTTEGRHETGFLAPPEAMSEPGAQGFVEVGPEVRPGVHAMRYQPFTSRGPAQVSSASYRKGWDEVFARSKAN